MIRNINLDKEKSYFEISCIVPALWMSRSVSHINGNSTQDEEHPVPDLI